MKTPLEDEKERGKGLFLNPIPPPERAVCRDEPLPTRSAKTRPEATIRRTPPPKKTLKPKRGPLPKSAF